MRTLRQLIGITIFVLFGTVGTAHAQIPVTDGASIMTQITNQIQTLAQWSSQYSQMATQIQQYQQKIQMFQQHLDAIRGARNMGQLLNNPLVNSQLPADVSQLLTTIKATQSFINERKKWPTLSNRPKTNNMFDTVAANTAALNDLWKQANDRMTQVKGLMGAIDTANDPAAKMDLANRLSSELNAIQTNQQLFNILVAKQKQDLEETSEAAAQEYSCNEFKRSGC